MTNSDTSQTTCAEPLKILFQDQDIVVINKPSGLLVHRSMIDRHETRFALQLLRDQLGQYVYPVHRLDKPTSGALAFALNPDSARKLAEQFQRGNENSDQPRSLHKRYLAVSRGYVPGQVQVDHPIKEELDKIADHKARQDKPAQTAISHFQCLATVEIDAAIERYPQSRYSLVDCQPLTGRKHQLRRHLKHLSHPIIGDARHGRGRHNRYFKQHFDAGRLLLHAYSLEFEHPSHGKKIHCIAPLDHCFKQLCQRFGWQDKLPAALQSSGAGL